jgi:DNA-binding GntR family transcriptional regulator
LKILSMIRTVRAMGTKLRTGVRGKDVAERRLREQIARGEVSPGQRLVEAELSERYGVTRNSARLALETLAADGLVERIPNRGARVRTLTTEEAVGIMECRMVLDGLLSRKATEGASDDQIDRVVANRERMEQAVADHDLLKYSELIQEHHALVREMAQHPIAASLEERLQAQIVRHQFQLSLRPGRAKESLAELERVIDAIVDRDPDRAEEAARAHFQGVIAALVGESDGT